MKKISKSVFLILVLASIPSVYFLLKPGFYEPQDLHHLADIFQMYKAIVSGQIPPRFGPDFLWGFGYPLFNLYYVLPFYLGAAFYALTKSLTGAFEFVFIFSLVASVLGMYLFLKDFFGKIASFAGSIVYLYTPYRAVQVYVRGAMGEALAVALLPFVFWGVTRTVKDPNKKNISILAVSVAGLILSHNYLWLLVTPFLVLFCLGLIYLRKERVERIKKVTAGFLLGAGISSYWWLPALTEFKLVSGVTPFLLEDHFPFIKQLILPSWGYGASLPGSYDGMSFQIGVVNLAIVALSLGLVILRKMKLDQKGLIVILCLFGFFTSAAMMNIRSLPLWKLLPIYQFVQFPWRLLFLTTFFSACLAAFLVDSLSKKILVWGGITLSILSLLTTWGYFRPSKIFYKPDETYLTRMFATASEGEERKEVSNEYVNWSEDYLLLPAGVTKPDKLYEPRIQADENSKVVSIERVGLVDYKGRIEASAPSKITFYALYFPGWIATLDGGEVAISQGKPHGQIEVNVPAGNHEVEFSWKETPLRKSADLVSIASIAVVAGMLLLKKKAV